MFYFGSLWLFIYLLACFLQLWFDCFVSSYILFCYVFFLSLRSLILLFWWDTEWGWIQREGRWEGTEKRWWKGNYNQDKLDEKIICIKTNKNYLPLLHLSHCILQLINFLTIGHYILFTFFNPSVQLLWYSIWP